MHSGGVFKKQAKRSNGAGSITLPLGPSLRSGVRAGKDVGGALIGFLRARPSITFSMLFASFFTALVLPFALLFCNYLKK